MKILITNVVMLNTGDAAILMGLMSILKQAFGADVEFVIYDSKPEVSSKYYPKLTFRRWVYLDRRKFRQLGGWSDRLQQINQNYVLFAAWCWTHGFKQITKALLSPNELRALMEYASADLIVSTGGTYLVENYSLEKRIFDFQFSLLLKKTLMLFTQSLGPFNNPVYQTELQKIFNEAALILLRDRASLKHLEEINVDTQNSHVSSDAAFALAQPEAIQNPQPVPKNSRLKVAISSRQWSHFKHIDSKFGMRKYQESLSKATEYLVEQHGAEVTFLSTCQGIAEYWTDDSKVGEEIAAMVPDSIRQHVQVDHQFRPPEALLEQLKTYDFVIATRMHMAILALAAGTPVLPIAYEFKTRELFDRLQLGKWVHDIELIEPEEFTQSVEAFIQAIPEIRQTLAVGVIKEQQQALAAGAIAKQALEKWQSKQGNPSSGNPGGKP
ncbi:polysaccharide pyruvyl transferase family protein [Cyanobacteria bacterium FACHB-471]|nr:polysaccharide pyruvyl transferase family protein [Cyanobacteria bacterium FACHB-471]